MIWLLAACLLWGPSFGLIPILRRDYGVDDHTLNVLRMAYSLLLFLPLLRPRKYLPEKRLAFIALGGLQFGLMYMALFASYRFLQGYEIALATVLTPLYVSLFDQILSRRPAPPRTWLCVALAVLGAGIIRYNRPESPDFWLGFGIMQLSNLCYAVGQILYRRLIGKSDGFRDAHVFGWMYLGGLVVAVIGWSLLGDPPRTLELLSNLPLPAWGILLWLGLVPSGLAFFLFNHGALRVDAVTLAIVNNLKIPIALILVLLIFRQSAQIQNWGAFGLGSALMVGALAWHERRARPAS